MKKKKIIMIIILIIPIFTLLVYGSWVILSKTIFAPTYNPNSNSVLFNAYNGENVTTYNGKPQGPTSNNSAIKDSRITFKYREAGTYKPYALGLPTNAGTYDILLQDKNETYINDVVRYTINKVNYASLTDNISISPFYEGDEITINNENSITVIGVNNEILSGNLVLKTDNISFGSSSSDSKEITLEFGFLLSEPNQLKNYDLTNYTFKANTQIKAIAYVNPSSKTYYGNLSYALNKISNTTLYVIPDLKNNDGTLHEIIVNDSLTLNNNMTLCLPYDGENYITSGTAFSKLGNTVIDTNDTNITKHRKTILSLRNGAKITVNSGATLQLGGIFNRVGITGSYTEINLGYGSSITCNGTFYCYGYIKENKLDAKNSGQAEYLNLVDNSFDSERFLRITNGGKLVTPLAIRDSASGGVLTALADANVCAINEFDMPLVQTYAIYDYGATIDCVIRMTAAGNDLEKQVGFIRPSGNSDSSIFYVKSGYIAIEYIPISIGYTKSSAKQDRSKIILCGSVNMGYLNLDVSLTTINTSKYFFPFSYKYDLIVDSSATFQIDYKIKFLPGSKLIINENGKINLNSEMVVYRNADIQFLTSDEGFNYPKNLNDSIFICNGLLELTNNGKIGAYIQHTNESNTGKIILNSVQQNPLIATSYEGTNKKEIILSSTALFCEDNTVLEKIIDTTDNLTSMYNANQYYWIGKNFDAINLNVIIEENDYLYPIYSYILSMGDDNQGSNQQQLSSTNSTEAKTYKVVKGKYININVNRALKTKIKIGSNELTYSKDSWYLINDETIITISPNEGVKISISTTGNSGAGKVEYVIYESEDESNWTKVASTNVGKVTGYVIKNYSFKFTTYSSYGYYFTTKPVEKDGVVIGKHGKENVSGSVSENDRGNNIIYKADGNYNFNFSWNYKPCILPDTLITMADGTYKRAEDIVVGDIVMAFNHETGRFEPNAIIINEHSDQSATWHTILNLKFSDNTLTRICGEQGFFDVTLNKYVYITTSNYEDFIGHQFYGVKSSTDLSKKIVTLELCYLTKEFTKVYSPDSARHFNILADNMLQMPALLDGLFNIFEYDSETLQFDQEKMQEDIEKYGLLTYDDFKDILPYEVYLMIPAEYLNVSIGKGYITWDIFYSYVDLWLDKLYKK